MLLARLPNELLILIFSFVGIDRIQPFHKTTMGVYTCNVLWKPIAAKKFGIKESTNYYRECIWQQKLYEHQFRYKSQWTLGCVGRIIPPVKEPWPAAIF